MVRFPALAGALAFTWTRLPPRSRLRRAIIARQVRQGCEAANRRDFDLLLLFFDPEIEFRINENTLGRFVPPDLLGVHRGHDGYLAVWKAVLEAWEDFKLLHDEVIDFGNRFVAGGRMGGHGTSSGIPVDGPVFQVFTLRRGLAIEQKDFDDRDEALVAAGLPE